MPLVRVSASGEVHPNPVRLKRDDQTIMWQLEEGVRWADSATPVEFLPGSGSYANWPGSSPQPIDTGAAANRRPYWASANKPMPDTQSESYHYRIDLESATGDNAGQKIRVGVTRDGVWYDPDVHNDPEP